MLIGPRIMISVDSVGRVDKSSFSQQTLMELLIDGVTENKYKVCGKVDEPEDITVWNGVKMNTAQEVTDILWTSMGLAGSLQFQWLPPTVTSFVMSGVSYGRGRMSGSIDLTVLPGSLRVLQLNNNEFSGGIALDQLPEALQTLDVYTNSLTGTLNLKELTGCLETLNLSRNLFTGTVCLTKFPRSLRWLALSQNKLCGPVDLTQLPDGMTNLYLFKNNFEGETDFTHLPESLGSFYVSDTGLSGVIRAKKGKDFFAIQSKVEIVKEE
mmetsp:Transcript_26401/g.41088  ORF Transcript_26401/g.41088 Transcript_26401/m.41088 type:complete len:268 (-) Transcript_26401:47-850(-)|eukprot:CAMPEP_0201523454 /NCGR_PEP_ID=MMETSP0161_2-20130828/19911_1 /ASSEMBLY_ACC=CAM_ASM_000251 /TAXON_ID=180227 /ORGANISM="Neoparamoeba aestuarina, Strain SoJaBio B1-5/56/2" /LENGTH=267 /DNA_ID=CAMNT_0047922569 /DNA_START=30 /DNA_END=833 /DNA_ORIENTATION=-